MEEQYIIGRNPVMEILKTDKEIDKIFVQKGDLQGSIKKIIGKAKDKGIIIQEVDRNRLEQIADGGVHQGIAALVTGFEYSTVMDIINIANTRGEDPFIIILDELEDPHNLGAIIRTAESAGAHGVIIPKRRSAIVNQTVYKSSAGAVNYMAVAKVTNISRTIDELKEEGIWIYGADMDGDDFYFNTNLTGSVGLVIGNEGKGISRLVKEKCDVLVKIPMMGKVSSLNASAAASILMYEVVRQENGKK